MSKLLAYIIEDEPHAQVALTRLLEKVAPQVQVGGVAGNLADAYRLLEKTQPKLLFLDIKLGTESGFDLLKAIFPCDFPIIFVTAYEEHALAAFRWNAVDYITKPIDSSELREAVQKAMTHHTALHAHQMEGLERMAVQHGQTDFLILRSEGQVERQPLQYIIYLQSDGGITHFYCIEIDFLTQARSIRRKTISVNIGYYDKTLSDHFFRCHQSFIVHKAYVKSFNRHTSSIELTTGDTVPVARRARQKLEEWMVKP